MANVVYNQLSARGIRHLTKPGRYTDGLGLMLLVDTAGNRRWVLRVSTNGKRRDFGLGSAFEVSLKEARERRDKIRSQLRAGIDPMAARKMRRLRPTFEDYSIALHGELKNQWKNTKHRDQWINTLRVYAFPKLGKMPIDKVDALVAVERFPGVCDNRPIRLARHQQPVFRCEEAILARPVDAIGPVGRRDHIAVPVEVGAQAVVPAHLVATKQVATGAIEVENL